MVADGAAHASPDPAAGRQPRRGSSRWLSLVALARLRASGRSMDRSRALLSHWWPRSASSSSPAPARSAWRHRCRSWSASAAVRTPASWSRTPKRWSAWSASTPWCRQDRNFDRRQAEGHGVIAAAAFSETEVLRLAAAIERASEHPLAAAIVRAARNAMLATAKVNAISTPGRQGRRRQMVEGRKLALGNANFMADSVSTLRRCKAMPTVCAATAPPRCSSPSMTKPEASSLLPTRSKRPRRKR